MGNFDRRDFIKKSFIGITGSYILLNSQKEELFAKVEKLAIASIKTTNGEAFWELVKHDFHFEQGLRYFNNASLGPSPEIVRDSTEKFRRQLDSFPSKYMWGDWDDDKEVVREKTAKFFGADKEEIALIHNTTEGMNVIAASLQLNSGDEIILNNHEHTSGTIPWFYWKETKGIKLVRPVLPLVPKNKGELVEIIVNAITPKTKVISICHILNTNGMIMPIKEICAIAKEKGILVVVDGAQAPGMLKVNLKDLGCDFYTASSHKWLFSPKGMGVFYATKEAQKLISPLIVSNHYEDHSIRRFENYNTRNLPELLGLGSAIDYINLIGIEKMSARILELKNYFISKLDGKNQFKIKTPLADELSAGIITVEALNKDVTQFRNKLFEKFTIDTRAMNTHDLNGVRISFGIYITKEDVDYLVNALVKCAE